MSWLDSLKRLFSGAGQVNYRWFPTAGFDGPVPPNPFMSISAAQMWRTQPHLRTVVTFKGRNVGKLGLNVYERVNDTDRKRDRTSNLARLIARPNSYDTTAELVFAIVADYALYDIAYVATSRSSTSPSGWELHRIPVPWVSPRKGDSFGYGTFDVQAPGAPEPTSIDAEDMLVFHGWSPDSLRDGDTPIQALKDILSEQLQAVRYRDSVWRRGGKVSSVITRPAGTRWTDGQREAFRADWNAKFTGSGTQVGGTPILEDGMTINRVDFSAHEQQFVEGAKLSLATVAQVFHINPTMIGLLDDANYSNVREFRKMLYGEILGWDISMIEDRLNAFLVPRVDDGDKYVEFNVAEKLKGNIEDQAKSYQASVGGPWMTRNEVRAQQNLPALENGDELIVPLNVTAGGQASPQDSAPDSASGDPKSNVRRLTAAE